MSKCHESDQQGACCTCTYHITILSVSISLSITIKSIYASQTTKHGVVPFGSIIIVNIKKFNYKEHSYVVHNYNAPPNALREVLVGKTTMCVKKKVGNKIDEGKQLPTGSRVHEKCEERQGMAKENSQHAKSLSVSLSSK